MTFTHSILSWSGEWFDVKHNHCFIFVFSIDSFLLLVHGFPFFDDFAHDIGLSERFIGLFDLIISHSGVVSVGGAESAGGLSILS